MEAERFKYGMNPDQVATFHAVPGTRSTDGIALSLNAHLDAYTGASLLHAIRKERKVLVYVKHRTPLLVAGADTAATACEKLIRLVRAGKNVEYGCLVANFELDDTCLEVLRRLRIHTVAAPTFSEDFLSVVRAADVQMINRGLVAVPLAAPARIKQIRLQLANGGMVAFEDAAGRMTSGDTGGKGNTRWRMPDGFETGLAVLTYSRTIAVVVMIGDDVVFVRSGFFDGIEALQQTLRIARDAGVQLDLATVFTDGCFGIRSPVDVLTAHAIKSFIFSGGKTNDYETLKRLEEAGIGALCSAQRYFSF